MSDSVVGICNVALTSLGANPINSLDEGTAEAILCNASWDNSRRAVLRMHPWNFAVKRIELAAETTPPTFDYKYSYPLPADSLRVLQVFNDSDYRIERKRVITNSSSCFVKVIFDNADHGQWDDSFKDLMTARIRAEIAYGITRSNTAVQLAMGIFADKLRIAKGVDASEDIAEPFGQFDNSLIAVRF